MLANQQMSTRNLILHLMKTKGSLSVNELAGHLGITEMAVRRHVNTLERDGYISASLLRQAMGRPTHVYALTDAAEELFPKNYHLLTVDLLQDLHETDKSTVDRLFERRKDKLVRKYSGRMAGKT